MSARESARLVDVALDGGVRHFDTARVYSGGESEQLLGTVLRHRDDVTVTTKMGLGRSTMAAGTAFRNSVLRPVARLRTKASPDRATTSPVGPPRGDFSTQTLRASVDTSRRLLKREVLDCVLLHEVEADQVTPALADLLAELLADGVVRQVGVATSRERLEAMLLTGGLPGAVAQFAAGPLLPPLTVPSAAVEITHSLFGVAGRRLTAFSEWVAARPAVGREIEGAIGCAPDRAALALALVRSRRPGRTVIVASKSPERLAALCGAARVEVAPDESAAVLAAADRFVAEVPL